jgi:hypothetical protein
MFILRGRDAIRLVRNAIEQRVAAPNDVRMVDDSGGGRVQDAATACETPAIAVRPVIEMEGRTLAPHALDQAVDVATLLINFAVLSAELRCCAYGHLSSMPIALNKTAR